MLDNSPSSTPMPSCFSMDYFCGWKSNGLTVNADTRVASAEYVNVCLSSHPTFVNDTYFFLQLGSFGMGMQASLWRTAHKDQPASSNESAVVEYEAAHLAPSYPPNTHLSPSYFPVGPSDNRPHTFSNILMDIPQARYMHPSKKGRTRYGRPIDLPPILFFQSGSRKEGIVAQHAFEGFNHTFLKLEDADGVVFKAEHAANITMHILVRIPFYLYVALSLCALSRTLTSSSVHVSVARMRAMENADQHKMLCGEAIRPNHPKIISQANRRSTDFLHEGTYPFIVPLVVTTWC